VPNHWTRRLAAHGKRAAIVFRPLFPCEVRPMKLGRHQGRGRPRLRMLLFSRGPSFEKGQRCGIASAVMETTCS
jgi:hypothetical protein